MDNFPAELELKNVVKELSQGRELAKQLRAHLNASSSSSSHENNTFLIQRILLSYDQALSMLTPPSDSLAGTSPHTDDSDQDSTKRDKAVAGWSDKIEVCGEAGILDDGYGWRKYGQKEILRAKYPRGYYRCTCRMQREVAMSVALKTVNINESGYIVYRKFSKLIHLTVSSCIVS